jgi:hypothetical protein
MVATGWLEEIVFCSNATARIGAKKKAPKKLIQIKICGFGAGGLWARPLSA